MLLDFLKICGLLAKYTQMVSSVITYCPCIGLIIFSEREQQEITVYRHYFLEATPLTGALMASLQVRCLQLGTQQNTTNFPALGT
jgi:hypothetical protein